MSNTEKIPYKIYLDEKEMPKQWYNVRADMKNKPAPLLNPGTHQPMGFDDRSGKSSMQVTQKHLRNSGVVP